METTGDVIKQTQEKKENSLWERKFYTACHKRKFERKKKKRKAEVETRQPDRSGWQSESSCYLQSTQRNIWKPWKPIRGLRNLTITEEMEGVIPSFSQLFCEVRPRFAFLILRVLTNLWPNLGSDTWIISLASLSRTIRTDPFTRSPSYLSRKMVMVGGSLANHFHLMLPLSFTGVSTGIFPSEFSQCGQCKEGI